MITGQKAESVNVLLHNDDYTTMDFVVFVLKAVFDKSEEEARKTMLDVHANGQGVAGSYERGLARSKISAVNAMARDASCPLRCTIENEEDATAFKRKHHQVPLDWLFAGSNPDDYSVGSDTTVFHSGNKSAFVTHQVQSPRGFGTLMQQFSPDDYLEKRLQMKMWVKTEDVEAQVQPWLRIDGDEHEKLLGFDNSCDRPITGTTDWKEYRLVLDVPAGTTNIAFGILLSGRGKTWMDDITFEEVGEDVSKTDCPCHRRRRGRRPAPRNLQFEE